MSVQDERFSDICQVCECEFEEDLGTERNAGISRRLYIQTSKEGRDGGRWLI